MIYIIWRNEKPHKKRINLFKNKKINTIKSDNKKKEDDENNKKQQNKKQQNKNEKKEKMKQIFGKASDDFNFLAAKNFATFYFKY